MNKLTDLQIRARARDLLSGDGSPRTREQVLTELEQALTRIYEEGLAEGSAREKSIARSEARHAITGAIQALESAAKRIP